MGFYSTEFAAVADLDDAFRRRMARLYFSIYEASCEELFLSDLAKKNEVLLVYEGADLVGFSTLLVFEREWCGQRIRVVYSGDTVVDRAHWGQQALAFDWISRMGALKRERPDLPLYWLLLVKGHRTFRYLPLFARSFHPHWKEDRRDLKPLADALAAEMFPADYNPATGVVEFAYSRGHLRNEIALPAAADLARAEVSFFLQRNPGFRQGHELVCLCEMETHNMKPLTLKLFEKTADAR